MGGGSIAPSPNASFWSLLETPNAGDATIWSSPSGRTSGRGEALTGKSAQAASALWSTAWSVNVGGVAGEVLAGALVGGAVPGQGRAAPQPARTTVPRA